MKMWRENTTSHFQLSYLFIPKSDTQENAHCSLKAPAVWFLPPPIWQTVSTFHYTETEFPEQIPPGNFFLHSNWQHPGWRSACIPKWDKRKGNPQLTQDSTQGQPHDQKQWCIGQTGFIGISRNTHTHAHAHIVHTCTHTHTWTNIRTSAHTHTLYWLIQRHASTYSKLYCSALPYMWKLQDHRL